jgi:hypothetical protein
VCFIGACDAWRGLTSAAEAACIAGSNGTAKAVPYPKRSESGLSQKLSENGLSQKLSRSRLNQRRPESVLNKKLFENGLNQRFPRYRS